MKLAKIVVLVPLVPFLFLLALSTYAQAPDTVWSRTYNATSAALALHETADSGFIMGGYIVPDGDTKRDVFMVRTDRNGDTLWTKTHGDTDRHESAADLYPTSDGGFILSGTREEDGLISNTDMYLLKTDANGDREWHSVFGDSGKSESGIAAVPTPDSGYLLTGYFWDATTVYDIYLVKTDDLGIRAWQQHMTWSDADYPTAMAVVGDDGFSITGYTQSFDSEYDYDMFHLRLDDEGIETWSLPYGANYPWDEAANHICPTSDGGYLMCGYRKEEGSPKDIYVVKTDALGNLEWNSQLGGVYHDEARCCIETVDGGYAVSASWYVDGNWKTALIKYDADGDTTWTAFWGDPANSHTPYGLVQTADNGYAVGGLMSGGTTAAFLVKFAAEPGLYPHTFSAAHLTTPVDDSAPATDTITVSAGGFDPGSSIAGIRVMIDTLDHPALEELTVTLTHDGTEVTLVPEGDASGENFAGLVFTDAAITSLGGGQAPYTGTFRASELLSAFNDMDPRGYWILNVVDGSSGNDGVLRAWRITLLTDVVLDVTDEVVSELPASYSLSQCYPNPFNPTTIISYSVPTRSDVTIEVYNVLGQKVNTLIDETKPAGEYQTAWNGVDSDGERVSTGVYFYRFRAGDFVETKKMLLLK